MSFWVILDDSIDFDELLAGADAAAIGAFLAEVAAYQAGSQVRMRIEWVVPAFGLPWKLLRNTGVIFLALLRRLCPNRFVLGMDSRAGSWSCMNW